MPVDCILEQAKISKHPAPGATSQKFVIISSDNFCSLELSCELA